MPKIEAFLLEDGSSVLVEIEPQLEGEEDVAGRTIIETATKRFEESLKMVRPAIGAVIETFREFTPNELTVEFGVKLNGEVGALVAKSAIEGHFSVSLKWKPSGENRQPGTE